MGFFVFYSKSGLFRRIEILKSTYLLINQKLIFVIVIYSSTFLNCNKKDNYIPPCYNCPVDFRVIDFEPAWSPDNKYIAYVHGDSLVEKTGIYLITPDGKDNHLWYASANAYEPTWSPDGQWIAFSDRGNIWKQKVNGDSLIQLTFQAKCFFPAWCPNNKIIAYQRSYSYPEDSAIQGIWTIDLISDTLHQVYSGNSSGPIWQTDKTLYFLRGNVSQSGELLGDSVFTYSFINKNVIGNFFLKGENVYLKYSQIVNKLAFSQNNTNEFQIWTVNADGSDLIQLSNTQGYSCDWSPDGKKIVYTDSRLISGRLWVMNSDGSNVHQLTFK